MNAAGGCACSALRYRLTAAPLVVHACHCLDCQRITGSAFVINIWIEKEFVALDSGVPKSFMLKGGSGKGHEVFFCGDCGTYVWSKYYGPPGGTLFVRAGTLDDPKAVKPDVHIHTRHKQPWLQLPEGTPAFEGFYDLKNVWPDASMQRFRANIAKSP